MKRIDAHQHFWNYDPKRDTWMTKGMSLLKKDFMPQHFQPILKENGFEGCVLVQVDQSDEENHFLLGLAEENSFIKGIVGWVDLQSENIEEKLENFKQYKKLKGFRHILQDEKYRPYMLKPEFTRGIKLLKQFDYTYDILIFPDQLQFAKIFIELFPDQRFIIDHLAKPYIKAKMIDGWKEEIMEIAQFRNVYCKISGMVTEANWREWKEKDFIPYIDVAVQAFDTDRILFGSDWPVCLLAADYNEVVGIAKNYFSSFTQNEQDKFFGLNAIKFYNL